MEKNVEIKLLSNHTAVAYPVGRLDVAVSAELEDQLVKSVEENSIDKLVLNMENVEYMSSSGFRVAIALLRKLTDKGGTLKICNLKPAVKRIFDVIELTSLFEIFDAEEEALASLT
ncbi:MAG: STAS domain-containing protein [Spirochaetia bacterium]|nr:STAS domain-containing protein [Spirochaetia bacterium]